MDQIFHKPKSKKKLWLIILCGITVVIALLVSAAFSRYNIFTGDIGVVTGISVKMAGTDTAELRVKYQFPCGGYRVRVVPEDEGEYIGDGMIDYDGSLGKYRIMVEFGDMALSTNLALKFAIGETVSIKNRPVKLRARIACPSDHGFVLYIGSDTPLSVSSTDDVSLNQPGGTLKIPVTLGDE